MKQKKEGAPLHVDSGRLTTSGAVHCFEQHRMNNNQLLSRRSTKPRVPCKPSKIRDVKFSAAAVEDEVRGADTDLKIDSLVSSTDAPCGKRG
jgi:hypothetical protein